MNAKTFLCLILISGPVAATPITVKFEGEIDSTVFFNTDPFAGAIKTGTKFSGTYRYDGDALDQATSPIATGGIFESIGLPYGFSLNIAGLSGNSFGPDSSILYRTENRFEDGLDIQTSDLIFAGINSYLAQIYLLDSSGTALDSKALPQGAPTLSDWDADHRTFFLGLGTQGDPLAIYQGAITKFLPLPEPGTLALLVIGLAALGLARRRRKI